MILRASAIPSSVVKIGLFRTSNDASVLYCFLFNAQSIANKLCELRYLLYDAHYDCIFVTESWLSSCISDGFLDPRCKYTIMRHDRQNGRGGGVCVLINKSHLVAQVTISDSYPDLEIVVFDLLNVVPVVRVFAVYRPPYYDKKC